jgi:HCOMODA/2-hydroxy-3-carboxy-muconic semialdehyde decarboxylase
MDENLLDDLVAANRILAEHGVIDAYGHVSIRSPDDPKRFYLARAIAPETVQREDIRHSPSVVPFSVTGVKMRALFHMASFIGDGLPNFEIRKAKKGSDLLVRTRQLGAALAKALASKPAALMRGHGSVVTGENLQRAVGRSIYLEMSARMQMQALLLSKRITFLDAAEVKASAPVQDYKRAWPLWREKALARARAERR